MALISFFNHSCLFTFSDILMMKISHRNLIEKYRTSTETEVILYFNYIYVDKIKGIKI